MTQHEDRNQSTEHSQEGLSYLHYTFVVAMLSEEFESEDEEKEIDEEGLTTYYFNHGFRYEEMLLFLEKSHNCKMSRSKLL